MCENKKEMEKIYSVEGYTLHKCIGEGVYSTVFMGEHNQTEEICAIKVVYKGKRRQRGTAHAQKEISALQTLKGLQHTVQLLGVEEDDTAMYLVLSLQNGTSLDTFPLLRTTQDILEFALALLQTIKSMHARGVYHLDIKPSNVMLCPDGPCILDFGCAIISSEQVVETVMLPFDGTPAYMAPEMIRKPRDARYVALELLDVWSFGCLLYYTACGREAFSASSLYALYPRILGCEISYKNVPQEIEVICRMIFQRQPSDRAGIDALIEHITKIRHTGISEEKKGV